MPCPTIEIRRSGHHAGATIIPSAICICQPHPISWIWDGSCNSQSGFAPINGHKQMKSHMLKDNQSTLISSAARAALAEISKRESLLAQEKAMLWLSLAASAFARLPSRFSARVKMGWHPGSGRSCAAKIGCPAGSIFAYDSIIIQNSWDGELVVSRERGNKESRARINKEDLLPGAPLPELAAALAEAMEGLVGFLDSSISITSGSRGQHGWSATAEGKDLLEAASFATAIGMPEEAALWESMQIGQASEPAKEIPSRRQTL